MAHITVDGTVLEVKEGALLIEELLVHKINIPHFCYHPALGKDGNCRMCMVEIEGQKRPQIACDTPIIEGMIVRTKGANIDRVKRSILELELINHPIDCPICDQAGECSLQNYYMDVGLYESRLSTPKVRGEKHVDLGANVVLDQERCVLCTRCVRFTKNITKTNELGVLSRADHSVISTFPGSKLTNPYAMNVVDLCPVGALTSKDFRFQQRVWFLNTKEAICDHCGRGCSIFVDHHKEKYKDEMIYRYRPRLNETINGYFICDAGRLSYTKENENQAFHALIRGKMSEYEYAEGKLLRLLKRHLGKTLFLLSSNLSLEEMVRVQKLSKLYEIALNAYEPERYDATFGDDFLKCNDRSANARALPLLGIDTTKEGLENALEKAELVVLIGRSDAKIIKEMRYTRNTVILCSSCEVTCKEVELVLPIASHTRRDGSFINVDGYIQYSACAIQSEHGHKTLLTLLAAILGDTIFTCKEVWDAELFFYEVLKGITFASLKTTPKIAL
ncbi:2Fe-2S iron-sulfur cluster-binding protein [Sulfurospirillum multivorans]|uniref:NADH-ubiquinone oxidoreductase chain G n=2 Tax=Sulfurospirillum multivorans TaxID=66821 RepID=A0AA86DX95_SULMK|nr:2Fe-2S iron-sulfur cluster-binding protein [Sulfurospirillum multivorans]AHJ11783.1 NADH-ubiquinone oxidoreductase chain G [Sulfurospirillum multivorans DSM 12446]QEH05289.1 NADH-ubiquinone oxidoreductase chain G [Sulfurospirillum multivorans]